MINTSSGFIYLFSVATDATGSISHWEIGVAEPPLTVVGEQHVQIETAAWVRDAGTLHECIAEGCGSAVGVEPTFHDLDFSYKSAFACVILLGLIHGPV